MTIADRIKKARKSAGLTQLQLSEKMQISIGTIRRFESGERVPKIAMIEKIAAALDTNTAYILGVDTVPPPGTIANENYNKLNSDGKRELDLFAEFLTTKPEFTK